MAANQVDFKILPSDQFSVYSPQTRSDKVITYFTLLSKLRGDILSVGQEDDPNNIVSAFYINTGNVQTLHLVKADGSEVTASNSFAGTVTSVDMSVPTGFSISGNPITTSGTLAVGFASGYSLPTNAIQATWTTAYNRSLTSAAVTGTSTKTLTLNQQDGGTITASWSDIDTGLTSVGLTMPAAFSVANSPLTANGTLAVTAAGLSSQYIRGDGQLANFPSSGGGGSSVNYYLNGSVSQGTFGGDTYYELSKTPIAGAGTNFTRTSASGDGYVASFITDANDPDLINIPGGNWNLEFYFNSSSSGGSPAFYGELYKVSVSNVFTLIASGSANSEVISGGTAVDQYYTSIAVPQTALLATDRLAIRVYVIVDGRNITLHTENSNFSEVITTFSTGLNSLNGLSDQVQYFAVGTTGTDFAISSSLDTHTFNLPTASATNRGALSSADWTTFNGKASDAFKTIAVTGQSDIVADSATDTLNIVAGSGVTLTTNATTDTLTISASGSGGTVTSVGTSAPLTGGPITATGTIGITQSGVSTDGYLSSNDWNTFNNKQSTLLFSGPLVNTSGTVSIPVATTSVSGYLNNTDWTTFNSKQNAITLTTTGTTGAATLIGATLNIPNYADQFVGTVTSVNMSVPTGFAISGNPITTSGTLAVAFASGYSLPTNASQTTWNTAYNDSITAFAYNTSTGVLTLTQQDAGTLTATITLQPFSTSNLTEGTNLYYTDTRARLALSAGTGITYDSATGVITNSAPDQTVVLTGGTGITTSGTYPSFTVTNSDRGSSQNIFKNIAVAGQSTIVADVNDDTLTVAAGSGVTITTDATTDTITISATGSGGSVTSVGTSAPITGGTITTTGTIGITQSGAAADGYLSSTDWNTFNNKQNALTNPVTGTGTTNYVSKFTSASAIGDSAIYDNAGNIGIGTTAPGAKLDIIAETRISYAASSQYRVRITNSDGNGRILVDGDESALIFGTSVAGTNATATERMRITSAGNVGIGTTAPQVKTHIYTATDISLAYDEGQYGLWVSQTSTSKSLILGYSNTFNAGIINAVHSGVAWRNILIATNGGNVGIGNTAPSEKLHVTGNIRVTGAYYDSGNSSGTSGQILSSTGTGTSWIAAPSGGVTGSGTTNYVTKWTSGSAVGNSIIYNDGINVSINTTAALLTGAGRSNLTIDGSSESIVTLGVNGVWKSYFYTNGSNTYVGSSGDIFLSPGGGYDKVVVKSSGFVGVGTTAPDAKLHVSGLKSILSNYGVGSSQFFTYEIVTGTSSSTNQTFDMYMGRFGNGYHRVVLWGSGYGTDVGNYFDITRSWGTSSAPRIISNGGLYIGGATYTIHWAAVGNGQYDLFIKWTANMPSGYSNTISYAIQSNTGSGYTQFDYPSGVTVPTLNSSNLVDSVLTAAYNTGNVGIGTTGPTVKLQVSGGDGIINNAFIGEVPTYTSANAQFSHTSRAAAGEYSFLSANDGETFINSKTGTNIRFRVNNNDKVIINSAGNVGIGTTAPQKVLEVISGANNFVSVGVEQISPGSWAGIHFGFRESNSSYRKSAIVFERTDLTEGNAQGKVHILNGPQSGGGSATLADSKLTIAENGNVGIGTTGPLSKLHVSGSSTDNVGLALFENTWSGGGIYYPAATFINTRGDHSYGVVAGFKTGSVGGTSDRPSILFYSDSASHSWAVGQVTSGWGTADSFGIGYRASNDPNSFGGWPTNYFTILTGGNVGIGTTSPGYKLDVSGTIRATGDVIAYSDARVKENVETLDGALDKVMKMRGVSYNKIGEQEKRVGVIAQEILEVLPEVVSQDETGTYSVAYGNIVSVLIEAIKEQQKQIDELKSKLK